MRQIPTILCSNSAKRKARRFQPLGGMPCRRNGTVCRTSPRKCVVRFPASPGKNAQALLVTGVVTCSTSGVADRCSSVSLRWRIAQPSSFLSSALDTYAAALASLGPTLALLLGRLSASTTSLHVAPLWRVHDDAQSYANLGLRATAGCPLWFKSRHVQCTHPCPRYPRKRTCAVQLGMSAKCQLRTLAFVAARSSVMWCAQRQTCPT